MSVNAPVIHGDDQSAFGPRNIILTGASRAYHPPRFAGPPSIKWMRYGFAHWEVRGERRTIRPDTVLLLPEGEEYTLTIESPTPSRTFCPVFRRGLLEGAVCAVRGTHRSLIDEPFDVPDLDFEPRRESLSGSVGQSLMALAAAFDRDDGGEALGWRFEALAAAFAGSVAGHADVKESLPGVKAATRGEILRRLNLAREAMEDELERPWDLAAMGRAACMAPHHFQRCFRQAFGETPRNWLGRRRCERALALLQTTRVSVTEVCLTVGYSSLGSFSAAFSRRFGLPPSAFARRQE
jgi:AraC family transcriptional regulator